MSVTYMTRQQRAVLEGVKASPEGWAPAAGWTALRRWAPADSGLAVRVRQLVEIEGMERLAQQGLVHKAVTDQGAYYQYCGHDEGNCFLLKCEKCGYIRHLDCSHLGELYQHLEREHHFRIDPRGTLFSGVCDVCAGEEDHHGAQ